MYIYIVSTIVFSLILINKCLINRNEQFDQISHAVNQFPIALLRIDANLLYLEVIFSI